MLTKLKPIFTKLLKPIIRPLVKLGISPMFFTFMGLIFSLISAWFFYLEDFLLAAVFLILSGLSDVIDGQVARAANKTSKLGSFLDSMFDRISDYVIFVGIILSPNSNDVVGVIALGATLLVSYARAKGESVGVSHAGIGLMERGERMFFITLLAFISWLYQNNMAIFNGGLIVFTTLLLLTLLHRIIFAWLKLKNVNTL